MKCSALLSDDGVYRYRLSRTWDETIPPVLFVGLNPSTADAEKDDNTIRRCIGFAQDWGYGGLLMGNLFAYRATKPSDLYATCEALAVSPVAGEGEWRGGEWISANQRHLRAMSESAAMVVAAWGSTKIHVGWENMPARVVEWLEPKRVHALGFTNDGKPRHPLYLPKTARPVPLAAHEHQWRVINDHPRRKRCFCGSQVYLYGD